jgi:arylamine N-acetyltransferase
MINIVTIHSASTQEKYFVDVGFGSSGPQHVVPLIADHTSTNVGSQSFKLTYEVPADLLTSSNTTTAHTDQHLWIYNFRHTDTSPWAPAYCFSEREFLPVDFVTMNHFTSTSRTSWFGYTVVCVKMIMGRKDNREDGEEEIIGDITLNGREVKRRIRGESQVLAVLESEKERVEALEKWLGVSLTAEERVGIRGMVTEIL